MPLRLLINTCFCCLFVFNSLHVKGNKKLTENYISTYKYIAIAEMERTGIPASIKLAQGILESDLGRSPLAYSANNHFGIKCGKDWTGSIYYKHDDDTDSTGTLIESCFRSYANPEESYIAHSDFLSNPAKKSRYGFLFDLGSTDYVGWANGLKFSGYATDPTYPSKLISIIEKYHLYQFDKNVVIQNNQNVVVKSENSYKDSKKEEIQIVKADQKADKPAKTTSVPKTYEDNPMPVKSGFEFGVINDLSMIYASGNQTVKAIAQRCGVSVYALMEYNEELNSQDYVPSFKEIVFLEKKKKNILHHGKEFHTVQSGETMYSIAQKYGIRLESLLAKNNLSRGAMPLVGESISLVSYLGKKETPRHTMQEKFDAYVDLGGLQ